jgi:hypothetical protein
MSKYKLNEDKRLDKLPVRYSDELSKKIEEVKFYNMFEVENIEQWINSIKGLVSWVSDPSIAWDNQNKFTHYPNGETYIKRYGLRFSIMTYKDEQGIEHNFVYIITITLNPQDYNLKIPPYLYENKKYKSARMVDKKCHKDAIRLNESHIRQIVRETLRQYLQL